MALMRKTQLSSKTQRLPVLDVLPTAYWVGGDTGLKQTSDQAWKGISLIVEELATIIPVPEAYLADADVPIWSEVQPRMVEAVGALIDSAVLWGVGKPSTWGTDIYTAAVAAGNTIKDGYVTPGGLTTTAATDFGQSVTALGDLMAQTGYTVSGFASRPGLNWRLIGLRSAPRACPSTSRTCRTAAAATSTATRCSMVDNGSWDAIQGADPRRRLVQGHPRNPAGHLVQAVHRRCHIGRRRQGGLEPNAAGCGCDADDDACRLRDG